MAKEEVIDEGPSGGTTTTPPSGTGTAPSDDIDLMALSCGDLKDLLTVVENLILKLKSKYDDTPKVKFVARRALQHSMDAQMALAEGIRDAMGVKHC